MNLTKSISLSSTFDELDKTSRMTGGTHSISNGVLTISTTDNTKSTYAWMGMYASPTSVFEITFEAKANNPNTRARVGIDGVAIDGVGGGGIDSVDITEEVWKSYKLVAPSNINSPYINLTFGFWSANIGSVSFRDIKIKEYDGKLHAPSKRFGLLVKNESGWGIDDRFSHFGIKSLEVVTGGSPYLKVNIAPFETRKRPLVFPVLDGFYSLNYDIRPSNATKTQVYLYIKKDGVVVDPNTITDNIFIDFLMIAD